jgi:RsiW-degrading membrane proteinase PrsW (M82 family)
MNLKFAAILISSLLGLYCIRYIRKHDIFEEEPFYLMIIATVLGGTISVISASFLYHLVHMMHLSMNSKLFESYVIIGPIEEFSKLLGFLILLPLLERELDEPVDYIIYIACVALGFSLIENFFYATKSADQFYLLFVRLLVSTPTHIGMSAVLGIAVFLFRKTSCQVYTVLGALVYAIILHGTFDFLIFAKTAAVFLLLLALYYWKELKDFFAFLTAVNRKIDFKDYIASLSPTGGKKSIKCMHCGDKSDKDTYRIGAARLYKCHKCSKYVVSRNSIFWLFHYFTGNYDSFGTNYKKIENSNMYTLFSGNFIDDKHKIGYLDISEMNDAIDTLKQNTINKFRFSLLAKYFLGIDKELLRF